MIQQNAYDTTQNTDAVDSNTQQRHNLQQLQLLQMQMNQHQPLQLTQQGYNNNTAPQNSNEAVKYNPSADLLTEEELVELREEARKVKLKSGRKQIPPFVQKLAR